MMEYEIFQSISTGQENKEGDLIHYFPHTPQNESF